MPSQNVTAMLKLNYLTLLLCFIKFGNYVLFESAILNRPVESKTCHVLDESQHGFLGMGQNQVTSQQSYLLLNLKPLILSIMKV